MAVLFTRRRDTGPQIDFLEYIQCTGTQYIDTGFKPNQDTRVVFSFAPLADKEGWYFGTRQSAFSADRFSCLIAIGTSTIRTDFADVNLNTTFEPSGDTVIDKNKNTTLINGQSFTSASKSFTSAYNLYLLCGNNGGAVFNNVSVRLYSCKIYDNGTLIRDYRPAKDESGVVCLYDMVNKQYVYNAGTGTFTAGPEI